MRSLRPLAVLALLSLLSSERAFAQSDSDKTTARELGQAAEAKLAAQDYKGAENDFRRANALYHAPTLLLGMARAQARLGKVVEAWENYHTIILENVTSPPAFASALADAQTEIATVESRRAKVTIVVNGADSPIVTIDGAPLKVEALGVSRFIDPGSHVFKASAPGRKPATSSLTMAEGTSQNVSLLLEVDPDAVAAGPVVPGVAPGAAARPTDAASTSSGSWNRTAGFVAGGVGVAALIEGVITGIIAVGKHSDLAKACTNGCPASEDSALSSYHTVGALSTVGFIVGGVGIAGGAILIFTAPKSSQSSTSAAGLRVTPFIGPGSAGATGTF